MARILQSSELHYSSIEKEATYIIEAVRKWNHLLERQYFTLITNQCSVAFMLDNRKWTKIKNYKILDWQIKVAAFYNSMRYRLGKDNVAPDTIT